MAPRSYIKLKKWQFSLPFKMLNLNSQIIKNIGRFTEKNQKNKFIAQLQPEESKQL